MAYKKAGKVNVRKHPRIVKRKIIPVRQHKRSYPESTIKRQQNSKINIKPTIGRKGITPTPEYIRSIALPEEKVKKISAKGPYVKSEKQKYKELMKEVDDEIENEISQDIDREIRDIDRDLEELNDELEELDEEIIEAEEKKRDKNVHKR